MFRYYKMALPNSEEYMKLRHRSVPHLEHTQLHEDSPDQGKKSFSTIQEENTPKQGAAAAGSPHPQQDPRLQNISKNPAPVVNMADFETVNIDDKLNLLMYAINKINTNFHLTFKALNTKIKDISGMTDKIATLETHYQEILARVDDAETSIADISHNKSKLVDLEEKVEKLSDDVVTLKGLAQVQDAALKECKTKIIDLTARSMANNITISGIIGDSLDKENCKEKALKFIREEIKLPIDDADVEVAHRLGSTLGAKPRLMVARCSTVLHSKIFKHTRNLKDKVNSQGDYYNVKAQLPEPLSSEKNDREERLCAIQKANQLIPDDQKDQRVPAYIKNKTLYVNKVVQRQYIQTPSVQDMFNISNEDISKMDKLQFCSSDVITDKKSHFRGHAIKVQNTAAIKLAYTRLRLLYPECNHVMMGYAIKTYVGFQDHGEYGAGKRLQKMLMSTGRNNTALFITREYGGIHLGVRRFIHIEQVARSALDKLYLI